jgi:hypothetical protein
MIRQATGFYFFQQLKRFTMNTISFPQREDPRHAQNTAKEIEEHANPYQHEINPAEGGEFLDDAIRTKDQPFEENKEDEWNDFLDEAFE